MDFDCCEDMATELLRSCDLHPDRFDCPDCLLHYSPDRGYGIIIHDGGEATSLIRYCPWCGAKFPESTGDLAREI